MFSVTVISFKISPIKNHYIIYFPLITYLEQLSPSILNKLKASDTVYIVSYKLDSMFDIFEPVLTFLCY